MYTLENVSKNYRQKQRTVTALKDVTSPSRRGSSSPSRAPPAAASPRCCRCSARWTGPPPAASRSATPSSRTSATRKLGRIRATEIGFVFQGFNLIPTLTAQENVETALEPLGVSRRGAEAARATAALASVGLGDRAGHLPAELSGGQQQRVAIARALVKEPDVLLADEPTGNLDEQTRDEIMDLLEGLWRDRGLTLVMVTHDSAVAKRAERRLHIRNGTVTERP